MTHPTPTPSSISRQINDEFNGLPSLAQAFIEIIRPYGLDDLAARRLYRQVVRVRARDENRYPRRLAS